MVVLRQRKVSHLNEGGIQNTRKVLTFILLKNSEMIFKNKIKKLQRQTLLKYIFKTLYLKLIIKTS